MQFSLTVNAIRIGVFAFVMLWTLIVFALLIHFQTLVIPSELTSFIPFGIIVSIMTYIILGTLIWLGRTRKPYVASQVRSELLFVGLLGFMWFALGLYTSTGTLADIEVECTDDDGSEDWDPAQDLLAQYRTVKALAFFNGILLLGLVLFILFLCIRHHIAGRRQVWTARVTTFPWFVFGPVKPGQQGGAQEKREPDRYTTLPPPVTTSPRRAATRPGHVSRPSQQPLLASDLAQLAPGESRMVWIPPPEGATRYGAATVGRSGSKQSTSSGRPVAAGPPRTSGLSRDASKSTTASGRPRDPNAPRRTGSGATRTGANSSLRNDAGGLSRAGTGSTTRSRTVAPAATVPSRSATADAQRKR
ncbi:transmembrane protein [Ceratobasidium sp. AG-Ba]|nr:transmembrane protein [Ceratobasidium sp. AG-Ba]QRV87634.1 transmembrane protein [Ceratobasidium sp. AG-Ba]QRW01814.1 transmembrane protein [Ceratobasidium sp. AG-Ba]